MEKRGMEDVTVLASYRKAIVLGNGLFDLLVRGGGFLTWRNLQKWYPPPAA